MQNNTKWLYFNIHNLVRMRVEVEHAKEQYVRLFFGPFEVKSLDQVDLTLQNTPLDMEGYSFASQSYLFANKHVYIKSYKLHLARKENGFVLASNRDLLQFVNPVLQCLLLEKQHCLLHSASVSVDGKGILLPGWGGTGKTSAIIHLLKELSDTAFLSDDYTILSSEGHLLSFPKAFFIYPYHKNIFPHLFKTKHKLMVPQFLSGALGSIRETLRPVIMAFPRLESLARRITPEHMQVPAKKALPEADFVDKVSLSKVLFVERYSGNKTTIDKLSVSEAKSRLIGNFNFEQGRCGRELILGAGGTAVIDLEAYYSGMAAVIGQALTGRSIYLMRMGSMTPRQTGMAVVDAVREISGD